MITSTMNYDEIKEEVRKDIPLVLDLSDKKNQKVRRAVLKSQLFPVRLYAFVTSPNKNRWLLTWEAHSRKNTGDNILFAMVCFIHTDKGRIAVMPSVQDPLNPFFFIFLPHFFQRFAERKGIELTGEDLMRRFFQYNANFSIEPRKRMVTENQYAIEATGTSEEGVALGYQLADGSFFFKTFISYEMAKGEQVEEFRESESKRIANHESIIDQLR